MVIEIKLENLEDLRLICDILERELDIQVKTRNPNKEYNRLNELAGKLRNDFENYRDVERNRD